MYGESTIIDISGTELERLVPISLAYPRVRAARASCLRLLSFLSLSWFFCVVKTSIPSKMKVFDMTSYYVGHRASSLLI